MRIRPVEGSADFEMIRALRAGDHGRYARCMGTASVAMGLTLVQKACCLYSLFWLVAW
jgi:hypothetical protein